MNIKNLFQSKRFSKIIIGIGIVIVILMILQLGVFIGYKKASFSYKWGENYHSNFGGPRGGFMGNFRRDFKGSDYTNSHGTFGSIIKIDSSADSTSSPQAISTQTTLVIKGKDDLEKTVLVSDKTEISNRREAMKASDLKIDDQVVIIGTPNDQGQIAARFIRIMPLSPLKSDRDSDKTSK